MKNVSSVGQVLFRSINEFIFVVVISDKQVPFRSLCSLPTAYLYINGDTGEFNSFIPIYFTYPTAQQSLTQLFRCYKLLTKIHFFRRKSLREKGNSVENKIWSGRRYATFN